MSLIGVKFSGKCLNVELADYERMEKSTKNTSFEQFWKDFDSKLNAAAVKSSSKSKKKEPEVDPVVAEQINKLHEETKAKMEKEEKAWEGGLNLDNIIGWEATPGDDKIKAKPKTKPKPKVAKKNTKPKQIETDKTELKKKGKKNKQLDDDLLNKKHF